MFELTLQTIPPLAFAGPEIAAVGDSNSAINGELSNIPVTIDNARGEHTQVLVAAEVLRARGELRQDGELIFYGAVQAITLGASVVLELEA